MSVPPFATRVARRALGLGLELFSTCALPAPMARRWPQTQRSGSPSAWTWASTWTGIECTAPRPGLSEGGRSRIISAAAKWGQGGRGLLPPPQPEITDARSGCVVPVSPARRHAASPTPLPGG